jgi:predicted nucleic-acid-binding Zn-ribbon protein
MSEGKKCPKCGGEMKRGSLVSYGKVRVLKEGDLQGDGIQTYYCRNCGFVELYKEPSSKEPWRFKRE